MCYDKVPKTRRRHQTKYTKSAVKKMRNTHFLKESTRMKCLLSTMFEELSYETKVTLSDKEKEEVQKELNLICGIEEDNMLEDSLASHKNLKKLGTIFQLFF